jgi:hypothetical protein
MVERNEMLARALRLVGDLRSQAVPACVTDRLREAAVLLHVLDLQGLDDDRLVFVNQTPGQLVLTKSDALSSPCLKVGGSARVLLKLT